MEDIEIFSFVTHPTLFKLQKKKECELKLAAYKKTCANAFLNDRTTKLPKYNTIGLMKDEGNSTTEIRKSLGVESFDLGL